MAKKCSIDRNAARALHALGLVGSLLVAAAGPTSAAPYTADYVFGDSLSDNGNLAELFYAQNFRTPPSYHDSFTNGPVAADLVAGKLGFTLTPSLWVTQFKDIHNLFGGASYVPGTNYAVAAATASAQAVGGVAGINLPQQVAAFSAAVGQKADPNALYYIEIGGNDVRNASKQSTGTAAVTAGVQSELAAIQALAAEGAKNFLVINSPNVGVIPEFVQDNPTFAASATLYSQQYDLMLAKGLASLALPTGTNITQFDLYAYNAGLLANAAALGFTDTTDRCYTTTPLSAATSPQCGTNAANVASFYYWDAIHPTAQVQALWAVGFENAIGVPEPSSVALLAVGLLGIIGVARRRAH